jgi:hypothetical protein
MSMTAHMQASVVEATIAREWCMGSDNTLSKECQSLCRLKRRAWRILSHDSTIEKRLEGVFLKLLM